MFFILSLISEFPKNTCKFFMFPLFFAGLTLETCREMGYNTQTCPHFQCVAQFYLYETRGNDLP